MLIMASCICLEALTGLGVNVFKWWRHFLELFSKAGCIVQVH